MTMVDYDFPSYCVIIYPIHTYNSYMRPIGRVLNTGVACLWRTLWDLSEWPDYGGGHISGVLTGSTYLVNECEVSLISLILSHKKSEVVTSF